MSVVVTLEDFVVRLDGELFQVGERVRVGADYLELRETKKGLQVVRLDHRGNFKFCVRLTQDGTYILGTSRGSRLVHPNEETDPIRRVLRLAGISPACMREMPAVLEVTSRSYDNNHCPVGRDTNAWYHDGDETELSSEDLERPQGAFAGGGMHTTRIEGASWAVNIGSGHFSNGGGWTHVEDIYVSPQCTAEVLADELAGLFHGAYGDFLEALWDLDLARAWVAQNLQVEPGDRAELMLVNGEEFFIYSRRYEHVEILSTLLDKFDPQQLLGEYFGEPQKAFVAALKDVTAAVEFALKYYRVVACTEGSERYVRYGLPDGHLVQRGSTFLYDNRPDAVLMALQEAHGQKLEGALWVKATERYEVMERYPAAYPKLDEGIMWWNGSPAYRVPLVRAEDAVVLDTGAPEFMANSLCLSAPERTQGAKEPRIYCALRPGAEVLIGEKAVVLPIRIGEKKQLLLVAKGGVWGITVLRTSDGLSFEPYDDGYVYTPLWRGGATLTRRPNV